MGGAELGLYAGAARYCRRLVRAPREGSATPRFELGACAGFEAGVLRGTSFGLRHDYGTGLGRWLAPELGMTATGVLASHFALSLEVDGLVPIVREHFIVMPTLDYRPGPATARGLLGLRVGW
jgi:hypothetical protein